MKLISRNNKGCVFLIGKRERQMMFGVLKHYPMLSSTYVSDRHSSEQALKKNEELLKDALAEQQNENRKMVQEFLEAKGRFADHELGYQFTLTGSEADWLLQVFNDIRVGSWVKLGSPPLGEVLRVALDEKKVRLCCTMEIAGLFESELLQALQSAE